MISEEQVLQSLSQQLLRIKNEIQQKQTQYIFTRISKVENGTYFARINGSEYSIPNATALTFAIASGVIVCVPNNDLKKRFIVGKYDK